MSTPTRKRRLPEWITSNINRAPKEAKSTNATNGGTSRNKFLETEEAGSRPSRKVVTRGAGKASSSRTREAKVSDTVGNSEDTDVPTTPGITEELDAATETIFSGRKSSATNSTSLMGKDLNVSGETAERKPRRELQQSVKQEPEERVGGVPLRRPSSGFQSRVKEEPEERVGGVPQRGPSREFHARVKEEPEEKNDSAALRIPTGESQFKVNEKPKGTVEDAPWRKASNEWHTRTKTEPEDKAQGHSSVAVGADRSSLSSQKEESMDMKEQRQIVKETARKNPLQKQRRESLEDDSGNYTSFTPQVQTAKSNYTSQQDPGRKVQQTSRNEILSQDGSDIREQDTNTHLPTREATNVNSKPLVRLFSKLLDGVIFTISGLVNPERAELRKMALDMGAEYRPSWSSDSTLLIAALANTPSFNQVKAAGGTIVKKDWVTECYKRKELAPMEEYLMHVGNPWRAGHDADESPLIGVEEGSPGPGDHKKLSRSPAENRTKVPDMVKTKATRAEIERWFVEDFNSLRSWLEKRPEKPEKEILEATAAQGLVACLEDAIRSLEENKGLELVLDSWEFIPRAIRELEKELSQVNRKERVVTEAERIKSIYTAETEKRGFTGAQREEEQVDDDATDIMSDTDSRDPADYNSDDTEDLDEDEITKCQLQILHRFGLD